MDEIIDFIDRKYINAAANIFFGAHDIFCQEQQDKYAGSDFVIVAAGPSLDKTWGKVKEFHEDGYKVVAVDRAILPMNYHEIPVDICVSIDPTTGTTDFFDGCSKDFDVWASLNANPELIQQFGNDKVFFFMSEDVYKNIQMTFGNYARVELSTAESSYKILAPKISVLPSFGHCTGTAYALCLLMDAHDIQIFGADYWFYGHENYDDDANDMLFTRTRYYASPIKNKILNMWQSNDFVFGDGYHSYPKRINDCPWKFTTDVLQSGKRCLEAVPEIVSNFTGQKVCQIKK